MQKPAPVYSATLVLHPARDLDYRHFEGAASHPFQADPVAGIPRANVWWLAESALLSYWSPRDAAAIFTSAGLHHEYFQEGPTDCYVAWQDQSVIVAFRGTEPDKWEDILTDLQLELVAWPHGRVHRGFKASIEAIWPRLSARIGELSPGRTVWFCGHSLGAALATLAADRYEHPRGLCTFGSPRVGDAVFAAACNDRLTGRALRYVNNHDLVTHVPPPAFGYKHVEEPRFITADGGISQSRPALPHFFTDIFGIPRQLADIIGALDDEALPSAPVSLLDHMPKAYAIWTWNDYDSNP